MSLTAWIACYAIDSAFCYWVVWRGGADWMEGWRALPLIGWWATRWNTEQIRLYMLLVWVAHSLWFVAGLVSPGLRW
ncbi:MAG: hypothetical protein LBI66_01775 [Burkholderiaceae bacterium]|jgi:hypothetical protein|nr:hypothetical protein [Burkholderiaceae bacterium]